MSTNVINMLFRRAKAMAPLSLKLAGLGLRGLLGLKIECHYRRFSIRLPADHLLPFYRLMHPTYDRFLPHLVTHLKPGGTVVDVGANCGDTLADMYDANEELRYICVEPDEVFFTYLNDNAFRMRASNPHASIRLYKALIGKSVVHAALAGSGGTKHAVRVGKATPAGESVSSVTLDALLPPGEFGRVELLKSDVDGYDFDVLDSAATLICAHSPILFFECHFGDSNQKESYKRTISTLQRVGYCTWVVFDNYGAVLLRTDQIDTLYQLFDYVEQQNTRLVGRTIRYFDVMAGTAMHDGILTAAVASYLRPVLDGEPVPIRD